MKKNGWLNLDFTLVKYKELCTTIVESDYTTLTFNRYFSSNSLPDKFVIIRHDVDRKPEQALKMAQIEKDLRITSTYYFRKTSRVFKPDIIKAIIDLGHEIGYHYEVLDQAKGDFEKGMRIFEQELKDFRKICDVKTICMHGNPLSRWYNRDLWKRYDFRDFGIIGEPYLSIDYKNIFYLTDTGRNWNSRFSMKDIVNTNVNNTVKETNSTDDVIRKIKKGNIEHICIVAHPERWRDSFGSWLAALLWQNAKNFGKAGLIKYRKTFHD
jgi:hypothetical protein